MIKTVSFGLIFALCINDIYDVPYVHTKDAASLNVILFGIFHNDCSGASAYSHNAPFPGDGKPQTRSPTFNDLTWDPMEIIVPENSLPGTKGGVNFCWVF